MDVQVQILSTAPNFINFTALAIESFFCVVWYIHTVKFVQKEEQLIISSCRYILMERRCSHAGGSQ